MITEMSARRSEVGEAFSSGRFRVKAAAHNEMAAFLCLEKKKGASSEYQLFLKAIPTRFGSPLDWEEDELGWLAFSHMACEIIKEKEIMKSTFKTLWGYIPAFQRLEVTFEDYLWARQIVATRAFTVPLAGCHIGAGTGAGASVALVPMADTLNHQLPADVVCSFDARTNCFVVRCLRDITKGMQVSSNHSNSRACGDDS
jgi:hypothetical protein